jgi:hypothetical protein
MKDKEVEQELENEIVEDTAKELESVIPAMNVGLPVKPSEEETNNIISDDALLGIYGEIMENLRDDRKEINDLLANFVEMVINEGDSTTSSKEALVNLVKIKSETADKMAKVADLMTRVKLKEKDTFPRYLAAKQENNLYIGEQTTKRELLKQIERHQKRIKDKGK